ncbi:flagellar hook-length control protein FliK [Janthinobacterium sp. PLB04]|uniref:Flagellar hook-length control protein FliK n=1 Tax=Janthinobacterium lividum TaxID=29581 RepID=A0AAJ4T4X7_9BURK|nr:MULTISPECIES: flagellar hook-length control protein FliK [Janthinobacterium]KAB0326436.1 flagellar hook-length control protein FliK [Janthinobacterium lividum]QSX95567.1 flagellar hook-length control protein FliK [Janthinobacterium lividum]UGQ35413.1 flagellar hook-length control protein FliK [Janthinobacterium sp. PLB04]
MLPKMDAIGMTPLTPVKATRVADAVADPRQAEFQRSLQGLIGKSMQGQVLARMGDGSFLVRVAGTPARMQLPAGAQPGTEIPLTLIGINPRPSFQIGNNRDQPASALLTYADAEAEPDAAETRGPQAGAAQAGTRASSTAATLLSRAPLTPANLLPALAGDTPAPELSTTARAISSVLSQAESVPGAPLSLVGKTPLMATPGAAPAQVAHNLRDAVGSSGLFYESHVAEWAEGKRPLASLLLEPQMQKAAQGDMARTGTDLASAQLINLQLHTHEQARVQWQGEAWPGQKMQWDISKDAPEGQQHDGRDGDEEATAWRSNVRFQFPLLGDLAAHVVLQGGRVAIQLQAGSEGSADTLRQHAARLEASLDAAGWPLSSLTIAGKPDAAEPAEADDA